jgi:hypothetical protein
VEGRTELKKQSSLSAAVGCEVGDQVVLVLPGEVGEKPRLAWQQPRRVIVAAGRNGQGEFFRVFGDQVRHPGGYAAVFEGRRRFRFTERAGAGIQEIDGEGEFRFSGLCCDLPDLRQTTKLAEAASCRP